MYSLKDTVSGGGRFPVSPNVSNVELKNCEYIAGPTWEAIDLMFVRETDEGDQNLKLRLFSVNKENCSPRSWIPGDTAEESFNYEKKKFNTKLKHIATKFNIPNLDGISGNTFKEYANNFCNAVNQNCRGVKLYCKTVKDSGGYTKMSSYIPFLQRMDSGECELAYNVKESIVAQPISNGVHEESRIGEGWTA